MASRALPKLSMRTGAVRVGYFTVNGGGGKPHQAVSPYKQIPVLGGAKTHPSEMLAGAIGGE